MKLGLPSKDSHKHIRDHNVSDKREKLSKRKLWVWKNQKLQLFPSLLSIAK